MEVTKEYLEERIRNSQKKADTHKEAIDNLKKKQILNDPSFDTQVDIAEEIFCHEEAIDRFRTGIRIYRLAIEGLEWEEKAIGEAS